MEKIDAKYYDEIVSTYKGYNYVVRLQRRGHRCGYVQVPDDGLFDEIDKKYHNWDYDGPHIECHGGLTYCYKDNDDWLEGNNWIGFDCIHLDDAYDIEAIKNIFIISEDQLEFKIKYNDPNGIPRSKEYVESHCKQIIDQLIELSTSKMTDKEIIMRKQYTADDVYKVMKQHVCDIIWDGDWFKVNGYDDKQVYVEDNDGDAYHFFYTDMAEDLNADKNSIKFYRLEEVKI